MECRAICKREGWDVAEVLSDNDIGASRHSGKTRPAWNRLAEVLRPGDVLVTWEASRAQRDLGQYVEMRDLCASRGVMLSYSGRLYDLTRGDDRFGTGLDALIAEREAEQTRERVLRAKRSGALAGRPNGRLPYGYRRVINMTTGATDGWVPDEATAPIVREIVKRVLSGESLWSVSRDLTARGVPAPATQKNAAGEWRPQRIRVMIQSPTYAGLRYHQGDLVGNGIWDPLIGEDEHRQLVAILSDPKRVTHRGSEPKHLLTGIARCGVCQSPMRYFGPKSIKTPRYLCEKSSCVARRADKVDAYVTERVLRMLEDPNTLAALGGEDSNASSAATDKLKELQQRLDDYTMDAATGAISRASFLKLEGTLAPLIEAAERELRATITSPALLRLAGPHARAAWIDMSPLERREAVRASVTVTIKPSTAAVRQFKVADIQVDELIPRSAVEE